MQRVFFEELATRFNHFRIELCSLYLCFKLWCT